MSGHFDDNEPVAQLPQQQTEAGRVDCGECPRVSSGCAAGSCLKAPVAPLKIQIGPLDV